MYSEFCVPKALNVKEFTESLTKLTIPKSILHVHSFHTYAWALPEIDLRIVCIHRYSIDLSNHFYTVATSGIRKKPTGWFMMTLVLRGPDAGIAAYHDATLVAETKQPKPHSSPSKPGREVIYIGRKRTNDKSNAYASLMADELTLWNRNLTTEEVEMIYQMY